MTTNGHHPPPDRTQRSVMAGNTPPDMLRFDAIQTLIQYINQEGPDRGAFTITKDGTNQQLPGISVPSWLMQVLNILSGQDALPYGHDRSTLHRDLVYMGAMAYVHVLLQEQPGDEQVQWAAHIIRQEELIRRDLFLEELSMHWVEDLAVAAGTLELRMKAGTKSAIYSQLQGLFMFVQEIKDKTFWRPTMLRQMLHTPEVVKAMEILGEDEQFRIDPEYEAWVSMLDGARNQ